MQVSAVEVCSIVVHQWWAITAEGGSVWFYKENSTFILKKLKKSNSRNTGNPTQLKDKNCFGTGAETTLYRTRKKLISSVLYWIRTVLLQRHCRSEMGVPLYWVALTQRQIENKFEMCITANCLQVAYASLPMAHITNLKQYSHNIKMASQELDCESYQCLMR